MTLPGWGVWGGSGIANPLPEKRTIIKAPPSRPRTDNGLNKVIISEK